MASIMPYYNDSAIASILIKIQVAGFQYMPLQPPFTTNDGYIVDHLGQRLLLQSVNWCGASDADNNVVMGLEHNSVSAIASLIWSIGFNSVRLPFSNQMVQELEPISSGKLTRNPKLKGKSPLAVFDVVVETLA